MEEHTGRVASRPYHHGDLHRALIDAAVAEIDASGPVRLSLRQLARRAGVSHAAPAHHFGDKAGLFTAVAIEGFHLLRSSAAPAARGADGLVQSGIAYVRFAVEHRPYFEVMFRPELYRPDDPELRAARDDSLAVLYDAARRGARIDDSGDVTGLVVAAWSAVHGFATLWLTANLADQIGDDLDAAIPGLAAGFAALGGIVDAQRHEASPRPRSKASR
jgi:AcrR family transcriptional regulator